MTNGELDELERLAKAATPGPWTTEKPQKIKDGPAAGFSDREVIAGTPGRQGIYAFPKGGTYPANDCRFIAAANPKVVLELIRLVRDSMESGTALVPGSGGDL